MFLAKMVLNGGQLPTSLPPQIQLEMNNAIAQYSTAKMTPSMTGSTASSSTTNTLPPVRPAMPANRNWAITFQEKQKYDLIFKANDTDNVGFIAGDKARIVFAQSGLHENMLAHIWSLCDMQNRGKLNSDEFAVAMHLIYQKLNGQDLPRKLPENLIPPSHKELSALTNFAKLDALQQQPVRRISPASSLMGLANILPTPAANVSNVMPEDQEQKKQELLAQVEQKRLELAKLKESTDSLNKRATELGVLVQDIKENVVGVKMKISPDFVASEGPFISEAIRLQFSTLENQIPGLLAKARARILDHANKETAKLQAAHSGSGSETVVVNKATALLAERMAALGVKSSIPTTPTSPKTVSLGDQLGQVEKEKNEKLGEIGIIEKRFGELSSIVREFLTISSLRGWAPSASEKVKFEQGIGLVSQTASDLLQELKGIGKVEPVQPVISTLPTPRESKVEEKRTDHVLTAMEQAEAAIRAARERSQSFGANRPTQPSPFQQQTAPPQPAPVPIGIQPLPFTPPSVPVTTQSVPVTAAALFPTVTGHSQPLPFTPPSVPITQPQPVPVAVTSTVPLPSETRQNFDSIKNRFNAPPVVPVANQGAKKPTNQSPARAFTAKPLHEEKKVTVDHSKTGPVGALKTVQPMPFKETLPIASTTPDRGFSSTSSSPVFVSPVKASEVPKPVASQPPPPPPPPPMNNDGSVIAIKVESDAVPEVTRKATKPKPADVGAQGPNLFELMNAAKNRKSNVANPTTTTLPEPVVVPADAKVSTIPSTNSFGEVSSPALADTKSFVDNPFGSTPVGPNAPGVEMEKLPSKSTLESDWEVVPKDVSPLFEKYDVVVEFDFAGAGEDDLPCKVGQTLRVQKEDNEWFYCADKDGRLGWVPKSFAKKLIAKAFVPLTVLATSRVLYDFDARSSDEISCKAGDIVHVLDKSEDNWWKVKPITSQVSGLIPSNFLEEIGDGEVDVNAIHDDDNNPSGGNSSSSRFSTFEKLKHPDSQDSIDGSSGKLDVNPFGSTFAMVVTPSSVGFPEVDGEIEDVNTGGEEKRRLEAIHEMIQTERTYKEELGIILSEFFTPMSQMPSIRIDLLFANLLALLDLSTIMSRDFDTLDLQRDPIGSVFLAHLDDLQAFKVYCENMAAATDYLQRIRAHDPSLNQFLKEKQRTPRCKHLDLSSYLLIPMQRITRYSLLLRQILHFTPKDHPHHDATLIALQLSDEFLDHVNTAIKEKQSKIKIAQITSQLDLEIPSEHYVLDLSLPTRSMGTRMCLHEGMVLKNKSGRKLMAYLFNDFLLLAQPKSGPKMFGLYRKPLMLSRLAVREASRVSNKDVGSLDNCCFQIIHEDEIITLRSDNVSEKRQWINQIESAIKVNHSNANTKSVNKLKSGTTLAIGTLNVLLIRAHKLSSQSSFREVFAVARVGEQILKSKIVDGQYLVFNQPLIFTILSLDDILRLSLYKYDKYSADAYLGQAEIQLDFLEYYGGRETELIQLPMKDGIFEKIDIKLIYRPA